MNDDITKQCKKAAKLNIKNLHCYEAGKANEAANEAENVKRKFTKKKNMKTINTLIKGKITTTRRLVYLKQTNPISNQPNDNTTHMHMEQLSSM